MQPSFWAAEQHHRARQGSEAGKLRSSRCQPSTRSRPGQRSPQRLSAGHTRVSLQSLPFPRTVCLPSKGLNHPRCPKPKQERARRPPASNSPSSLPCLQLGTDKAWGQMKLPGARRETCISGQSKKKLRVLVAGGNGTQAVASAKPTAHLLRPQANN